ncbi:MAG TPA: hypothetical protein VEZ47_13160, partial [Gemmatirosa sp.]|nr:hypothetical protein [Gemmatirosa sp.]
MTARAPVASPTSSPGPASSDLRPPTADAARRARLRECTVLLVDDEEANLDLLEALLEGEGYGAAGGGRLLRTGDPREV